MSRGILTLVLFLSTACGTGRMVPADQPPTAAPPPSPTAPAGPQVVNAPAPAPQPGTPQPDSAVASAYSPYGASVSLPLRRIGQWSTSGVTAPERLVIRDDSSYARFWARLGPGAGDRPSVDFSRDVVIAVAAGERQTGGYSITVDRVVRSGPGLSIQVVETVPALSCPTSQSITQPVDAVAVGAADARTWSFADKTVAGECR